MFSYLVPKLDQKKLYTYQQRNSYQLKCMLYNKIKVQLVYKS